MSKQEKQIKRLKEKPKDFTFDELITLLGKYGYTLENKGNISGSRCIFKSNTHQPISMHKYHNRKALLNYEISKVIKALEEEGII